MHEVDLPPAEVEALDLALELTYSGDATTLTEALAEVAALESDLRAYLLDWDRDIGNAAAETGDWDTAFAALPF